MLFLCISQTSSSKMSDLTVESRNSDELKTVLFVALSQTQSLFAHKKIIRSSHCSCSDNQPPFGFHIRVAFGLLEDGWLSVHLVAPNDKDVFVNKCKITLLDVKKKPFPYHKYTLKNTEIKQRTTYGWTKLFSKNLLILPGFTEIKIKCDIAYQGLSSDTPPMPAVKPWDTNLNDNMLALLEDSDDYDVTFLVEEEKIQAHKLILTARSTYFQRLFRSGMQESITKEVKIEGVNPSMFKELLKFSYSGLQPKNINAIAMELLPLADQYEMLVLKEMCVSAIYSILSVENVIDVLLIANSHHCRELTKRCIPIFKGNIDELKRNDNWNKLRKNPDLMVQLLASFGK